MAFGGYSEDSYWKDNGPFAWYETVYIPKSTIFLNEPPRAMMYFLFELQNATRANKFLKLR